MRIAFSITVGVVLAVITAAGQAPGGGAARPADVTLLRPDRVFDGETMHAGWSVLVRGERIEAVGASVTAPADAQTIALPGTSLLPGLIEGHSHLLLHPYNETPWNDQVAREPLAYRVARAVNHARDTLMAGVTTVRDLGRCSTSPSRSGPGRARTAGRRSPCTSSPCPSAPAGRTAPGWAAAAAETGSRRPAPAAR